MSFLGTIAAGAIAEAYNEDKAAKEAQVAEIQAAKRQWLFTTGMENIKNRRERRKAASGRVSQAQRFGFSRKSAMALEMSGQLEFELDKVQKLIGNNKLAENYIPTLVAYLEDKVENDEQLSAAISRGLEPESLVSEEEMSLGLINSLGDLNQLQEQFMKTTEGGGAGLPAFQYTPTKGARIELADSKSIRAQLASTLSTMYSDSFQVNAMGDVTFTQNAKPEVQKLFNDLASKTIQLAEDPTNSYSPTSALNRVISTIQTSQFVPPNVVVEKLDEALETPDFSWEPFKVTPPPTPPGGPENGSPADDM